MKKWLFTLTGLLAFSACAPLSSEQWNQLQSQSNGAAGSQTISTVVTLRGDFRGSSDVQYVVTTDSTSPSSFTIRVSRANGAPVDRLVSLNPSNQAALFQMMVGIFASSVTIQSRAQCTDCNGWGTLTTARTDVSSQQYNYPVLVNTPITNPVDQLNQFILSQL